MEDLYFWALLLFSCNQVSSIYFIAYVCTEKQCDLLFQICFWKSFLSLNRSQIHIVKHKCNITDLIWTWAQTREYSHCSVQFSLVAQSCPTLCYPMNHSTPGLPVHHQLLESTMFIESVMPSNHFILCHPLLLLPSIFPSIRVISNESALCMRWPNYWSFSFNISPSNEHPGLISFRMD